MTYCEIYNEVAGDEKNRLAELDLSTSHRAAWAIVKNLNGRSGFDAWWESIDDEIKDEIFARIVNEIKKAQALVA